MEQHEVIVIGSGPAGLASAAELERRGVESVVLERGAHLAAVWRARYDALRLNTSRRLSALPGHPFPRGWGQFPTRDQYVGYLERYATEHSVTVRTGVDVQRLDRTDERWVVSTDRGDLAASTVVVATGIYRRPVLPDWAADSAFGGHLLHASEYRNAEPFIGQRTVVVGAGSTGMEIAHQLTAGGAARSSLAFRSAPNVVLREVGGLPADLPMPLMLRLPVRWVDPMLLAMQRVVVGDLSVYGLPRPSEGPIAALRQRGAGTAVVDRAVVQAIRDGSIRVVPEVVGLDGDGVVHRDGTRTPADAVIAATGYDTGLTSLVGHLGVLGERGLPLDGAGREVAPGLRFVGYVLQPGLTGVVGRQARRMAREIAAAGTAAPPARVGS